MFRVLRLYRSRFKVREHLLPEGVSTRGACVPSFVRLGGGESVGRGEEQKRHDWAQGARFPQHHNASACPLEGVVGGWSGGADTLFLLPSGACTERLMWHRRRALCTSFGIYVHPTHMCARACQCVVRSQGFFHHLVRYANTPVHTPLPSIGIHQPSRCGTLMRCIVPSAHSTQTITKAATQRCNRAPSHTILCAARS